MALCPAQRTRWPVTVISPGSEVPALRMELGLRMLGRSADMGTGAGEGAAEPPASGAGSSGLTSTATSLGAAVVMLLVKLGRAPLRDSRTLGVPLPERSTVPAVRTRRRPADALASRLNAAFVRLAAIQVWLQCCW